jgi:hydroxymethylpyrimidine/phosphomethylpyrimidine kinase
MFEISKPLVVMTIGGLDPSGGAGVIADIKTIAACGCYGVAVVTSITFQNTLGVSGASNQAADTVRRQMMALLNDFEIAAVKTGMLPTREIVSEVASIIKAASIPVVVVDPVLKSTSGFELAEEDAARAIPTDFFPVASVITPNVFEAQHLSGEEIRNLASMQRAAQKILALGPRAVLITGGDLISNSSTDVLADKHGLCTYTVDKIESRNTHGTGCTFASALACLLAKGQDLRDAIPIAKRYIVECILSGPALGHGNGPLNHFPRVGNENDLNENVRG